MEVDAAYPAAAAGDELRRLLAATLSADKASVDAATAGLDRISAAGDPRFPIALLAVAAGTLPHTTPVDPVPSRWLSCARFCGSPWLFAAGEFSGSVAALHFKALDAAIPLPQRKSA